MNPTLEAVKGSCGSIKVGTTGTISSLMTKELESASKNKHVMFPTRVSTSANASKTLEPRTSAHNASSSSNNNKISNNKINYKTITEIVRKTKHHRRKKNQIPMLYSGSISQSSTPCREKSDRRGGSYLVEVVDIKCGNPNRKWVSPITKRLKKLGFSKLSETII